MISKPSPSSLLTTDEMFRLMRNAVQDALAESRRLGVPIPFTSSEGRTCYELPDGSVADQDPWLGQKVAPPGWYERFGISPPQ
jgi:hypothetical protein